MLATTDGIAFKEIEVSRLIRLDFKRQKEIEEAEDGECRTGWSSSLKLTKIPGIDLGQLVYTARSILIALNKCLECEVTATIGLETSTRVQFEATIPLGADHPVRLEYELMERQNEEVALKVLQLTHERDIRGCQSRNCEWADHLEREHEAGNCICNVNPGSLERCHWAICEEEAKFQESSEE